MCSLKQMVCQFSPHLSPIKVICEKAPPTNTAPKEHKITLTRKFIKLTTTAMVSLQADLCKHTMNEKKQHHLNRQLHKKEDSHERK